MTPTFNPTRAFKGSPSDIYRLLFTLLHHCIFLCKSDFSLTGDVPVRPEFVPLLKPGQVLSLPMLVSQLLLFYFQFFIFLCQPDLSLEHSCIV